MYYQAHTNQFKINKPSPIFRG